jgi:CCR4-NOT transcriptional regulation complex NOT5 subunit
LLGPVAQGQGQQRWRLLHHSSTKTTAKAVSTAAATKSAKPVATKKAATSKATAAATAQATASATPTAAASTAPATTSKGVTGTFTGPAVFVNYGTVQVKITVSNGKITDAVAVQAPSGRNDRYTKHGCSDFETTNIGCAKCKYQGCIWCVIHKLWLVQVIAGSARRRWFVKS